LRPARGTKLRYQKIEKRCKSEAAPFPSSKIYNSALLDKFHAMSERELMSPEDALRHAY